VLQMSLKVRLSALRLTLDSRLDCYTDEKLDKSRSMGFSPGFFGMRSRRYIARFWAYFWACFLSCAFVLSMITPALAQSTVTWEDLQAQSTQLRNPYEHLTTAQTYQLSELYQLRDWVEVNQPAADSWEVKNLQRLEALFAAEGMDTDELLKEAEVARKYWAAKARATNVDIVERPVQIDGYVLPLGANSTQVDAQGQLMNEFLLVPYVGACVHTPAPSPNQLIYIETAEAVENPGIFSAVQVEGELQVHEGSYEVFQIDGSRTVDVSYRMELGAIAPTTNQPVAPSQTGRSLLTLQGWKQLPATISGTLTTALNKVQNQKSPGAMIFALLLSLSYGVLHTLGPGHGKAVIVSYFVGQGGSLRRGLLMGGQIAIFHVLSAILLVVFTHTVMRQMGGTPESNYRVVQLISYGAIALLGGWMLRRTFTRKTKYPLATSVGNAQADKSLNDVLYPSLSQQIQSSTQVATQSTTLQAVTVQVAGRQSVSQQSDRDEWLSCSCLSCSEASSMSGWLALAVGAVPCSGALLVLLYGLANNMLWQSVAMVLAISAGMAMTLAWIGIMAIMAHRWGAQATQQRIERKKKAMALPIPLTQLGRIVSASCVCLLGLSLFAATWVTGV